MQGAKLPLFAIENQQNWSINFIVHYIQFRLYTVTQKLSPAPHKLVFKSMTYDMKSEYTIELLSGS